MIRFFIEIKPFKSMVSVLLIDDDIHLCVEIRLGLERAGYEVMVATGGNEGLVIFEREPQDVVITDVVMDDGEGVGTMGRLRQLAPDLPVIAISAHEIYLETMTKLGANCSLYKPFKMTALIAAVTKLSGG